ncbi:MAG: STAS domain-containing protein [Chloroflexi bacterium]|nr:STAS domain-containing protein [Chloroflexota bacterium]
MATQPLETTVHHQPGIAIIELYGEINALGAEVLNTAYTQAQSRHPELVLLNFAGVNYINSPGLGLIIGLLAQARQTVVGCGLSAHYLEIFAITGLTKLMPIVPDEKRPGHAEGLGLSEFHFKLLPTKRSIKRFTNAACDKLRLKSN